MSIIQIFIIFIITMFSENSECYLHKHIFNGESDIFIQKVEEGYSPFYICKQNSTLDVAILKRDYKIINYLLDKYNYKKLQSEENIFNYIFSNLEREKGFYYQYIDLKILYRLIKAKITFNDNDINSILQKDNYQIKDIISIYILLLSGVSKNPLTNISTTDLGISEDKIPSLSFFLKEANFSNQFYKLIVIFIFELFDFDKETIQNNLYFDKSKKNSALFLKSFLKVRYNIKENILTEKEATSDCIKGDFSKIKNEPIGFIKDFLGFCHSYHFHNLHNSFIKFNIDKNISKEELYQRKKSFCLSIMDIMQKDNYNFLKKLNCGEFYYETYIDYIKYGNKKVIDLINQSFFEKYKNSKPIHIASAGFCGKDFENIICCGINITRDYEFYKSTNKNILDENGLTPIMISFCKSRIDIANYLFNKGASLKISNEKYISDIFQYILENGNEKIILAFIDENRLDISSSKKYNLNKTILGYSCDNENLFKSLLKRGANIKDSSLNGYSVLKDIYNCNKKTGINLDENKKIKSILDNKK